MENEDFCPMYVDYVRECTDHFSDISLEMNTTLRFCTLSDHVTCPFFKYLQTPSKYCPNFTKCDMCRYYKNKDFEEFLKTTDRWCLSDGFVNCARYRSAQSGQIPAPDLTPDGNTLEK